MPLFFLRTSRLNTCHSARSRHRSSVTAWLVAFAVLGLATTAPGAAGETAPERPKLQASRAPETPTLDGEVLADPAWQGLSAATGFVQSAPDEGQPASETTEVFVTFDDDNLYIGVVCHDRRPEDIIVVEGRRDLSLDDSDSFRLLLDTYDDDQSAFVFGTNPTGSQYDGHVTRDGLGETGGSGSFDLNWDGAWSVAAKRTDDGWSAEMAIPFRTLRYTAGEAQSWGINFQRTLRRRNENAYWSPIPRQFGLTRVSLAGQLEGVEPPQQKLLQVIPYVLAEVQENRGGSRDDDEDFEAGIDIKYGLTPSLTLEATVNPDFAQVEADVQQINFDRFNLFFPEKRPFFLENAGLFRVGVPAELELFFSRSIGITGGGQALPIDGGLRLSGQVGQTQVGVLAMRTDGDDIGLGDIDDQVARVSQQVGERSAIGFVFTQRRTDAPGPGDDRRRTFGLDGHWGVSQKLDIKAFVARTDTPGVDGDDHAFRLGADWNTETLVASVNVAEVGEEFDPALGFLWRTGGYRKADGFVLYRYRPEGWGSLLELQPHIYHRTYWNVDGGRQTNYTHIDNHWVWKNGAEIHTGVNLHREVVQEPFVVAGGAVVPAGIYSWEEAQFGAFSNRGAPISVGIGGIAGGFFGGDRLSLSPSLRFRRGDKLSGEIVYSHNDIDLPSGDFKTDLGRLRLAYAFTPKLFLEGLVQYNNTVDQWSTNLRFGWRDDANTGLYIVYNSIEETGVGAAETQRRWIIKYSRLVNLLGR